MHRVKNRACKDFVRRGWFLWRFRANAEAGRGSQKPQEAFSFPTLSVPRIEVDQHSRDARLRLEHVEGMLILAVPSTRFWLRRGLHRLLSIIGLSAEETVSADSPRSR